MKRIEIIFTVILTVLFVIPGSAQKKNDGEQIFFVVEEMPQYPGGEQAMKKYIAENIHYPEVARKNEIEGKVFVTFVVSDNGNVKEAQIAKGVSPELDREAVRVINEMPRWKAGKQKGEAVNVKFTLPIYFKLGSENRVDEDTDTEEMIFYVVEEMPEFPGGEKAMQKYIADNIQYPKTAREKGIQGKVFITFTVSEEGDIKNAKVIRSVDPLIDKEALCVINSMPSWTPGKQRGKKVDVQFTLPINFALNDESQPQKN